MASLAHAAQPWHDRWVRGAPEMIYLQTEDQQRAMAAAEPLLRPVHDDIRAGFARYWGPDYSDSARAEHSKRTTANIVYDHAERLFRLREDEISGLRFFNKRGLVFANYQDKVILRLKKVDVEGHHANYRTDQQLDFDEQLSFQEFPDAAFRLYAGYQTDMTGSYVERVMIVRQVGDWVYWCSQVNLIEEEATWEDATPARLFNMDLTNYRSRRSGRGG